MADTINVVNDSSRSVNDGSRSVNYDSTVMLQIVASLMIVIYDFKMFIVQATNVHLAKPFFVVNDTQAK